MTDRIITERALKLLTLSRDTLEELERELTRPQQPASPDRWLLWPSLAPDRKLTQPFGARPEFYQKFGLPGHEGVDIRAPNGTPIVAAALGIVTEIKVNWRKSVRLATGAMVDHNYGYHIRINHTGKDGEYQTIYAHFKDGSAKFEVGEWVAQGMVIGLADNTGNSSAAHLHFGLKKLPVAKDDPYRGCIDPMPHMIDPPM